MGWIVELFAHMSFQVRVFVCAAAVVVAVAAGLLTCWANEELTDIERGKLIDCLLLKDMQESLENPSSATVFDDDIGQCRDELGLK